VSNRHLRLSSLKEDCVARPVTRKARLWFDLGWQLRRGHLDHALITPQDSIGVIARKGSSCLHVESASYDYIGLDRTARFGFDSR
jgi:hypothetical protein